MPAQIDLPKRLKAVAIDSYIGSTGERVVLAKREAKAALSYVTWQAIKNDKGEVEFYFRHDFTNLEQATADFKRRCKFIENYNKKP